MLDPKFFDEFEKLAPTSSDILEISKQIKDKEIEFDEAVEEMYRMDTNESMKESDEIIKEEKKIDDKLKNYQIDEDEAENERDALYSEYSSRKHFPIRKELIFLGRQLSECLENLSEHSESIANIKKELVHQTAK